MIGYLVLSHTDPEGVARLVRRLLDGDPSCVVLVHHDGALGRELGPPDRVEVVRYVSGAGWGRWGLVEAELRAIARLRERWDPDWLVLLSGQDWPLRAPAAIRDELLGGDTDAYVLDKHVIDPPPVPPGRRWWTGRYFYRWYEVPVPARLARAAAHRLNAAQQRVMLWPLPRGAGTLIGFRRRRTPYSPQLPCRSGSQWMALSRKALDAVDAFLASHPAYVAHYRRTVVPDESFFTTIVHADPVLRVTPHPLTFMRMEGADRAHAATLGPGDVEAALASGRAFARKVTEDAVRDALDAASVV